MCLFMLGTTGVVFVAAGKQESSGDPKATGNQARDDPTGRHKPAICFINEVGKMGVATDKPPVVPDKPVLQPTAFWGEFFSRPLAQANLSLPTIDWETILSNLTSFFDGKDVCTI